MGLICKLKGHDWKNGFCTRCHIRHETNEHIWENNTCSICGANVFEKLTAWQGQDADLILDSINRSQSKESQADLSDIALRLLITHKKESVEIGEKTAAFVTDGSVLLQRFALWAQRFDEEKCKEEWDDFTPVLSISAFTGVDDVTKDQMEAIIRTHLINIALNARYSSSAKTAIRGVGSLGELSDEDAGRFVPLSENSVYALNVILMLMNRSPIWKTLLTKTCISALGGKLKEDDLGKDCAADLLIELYHSGCQMDAIRKYNGTVLYDACQAPTDDDNYGVGSHGAVIFHVF